jgi:hypothetical protein
MAKNTMDFARQSTEQAVQATDWMRAIAEQNLNQSKAAFEDLLTIARNAKARGLWSQERKAHQTQKLVDPRSDDKVAMH